MVGALVAVVFVRLEGVGAAAERDVDFRGCELPGDGGVVARVGEVGVECGGRGVGEAAVGDEADAAALFFRQLEEGGERLSIWVNGEAAMVHFASCREGGAGGGGVGDGEVAGGVADHREVGEGVDGEPVVGAAFVKARGGEVAGDHSVADEEDDAEGL